MGNRKMILSKQQIARIFHEMQLEDNYNFLEDDLVKLVNAYIDAAKPLIVKEERVACVEVARAYNALVADKILEVRNKS
jgi:hypothetical protein